MPKLPSARADLLHDFDASYTQPGVPAPTTVKYLALKGTQIMIVNRLEEDRQVSLEPIEEFGTLFSKLDHLRRSWFQITLAMGDGTIASGR